MVAAWELYWRGRGFKPSIRDGVHVWARTRGLVNERGAAFVGTSRFLWPIRPDIFADEVGGESPAMLAVPGAWYLPAFEELVEDESFAGTIYLDIAPSYFFRRNEPSRDPMHIYWDKYFAYFDDTRIVRTVENELRAQLQARFATMSSSLDFPTLLRYATDRVPAWGTKEYRAPWPFGQYWANHIDRARVHGNAVFPESINELRKRMWEQEYERMPELRLEGEELDQFMSHMTDLVSKLEARGGRVIMIRMPTSGRAFELENAYWPTHQYWDRLLEETGALGIDFETYPNLRKFVPFDEVHLAGSDGPEFTRELAKVIASEVSNRHSLR